VSKPPRAVFLSYASQDAQAAQRINDALRSSGIEVWFDRSELRGGEAWDRHITKQIHDCALFMAVISAHTEARSEGYFRREWRIALDRARNMADDQAFLMPVVIDATASASARVPDQFREVQWTALPAGATPPAFIERISHLLSLERHDAPAAVRTVSGPGAASEKASIFSASAWRSNPALPLITAAVVIAAGYFAIHQFGLADHGTHAPPPPVAAGTLTGAWVHRTPAPVEPLPHPAIDERSIAVLPFVDMSERKDQEYFSDGLSEELIELLGKTPGLKVIARTSSFYFKGRAEKLEAIAQELHVANVLEGSVRKSGSRLRVTAQLIRADTSEHIWSETFDRDLHDVFKVQDEIASAVVTALKMHLLSTPTLASHEELRTGNLEAYNQYLRGWESYNLGDMGGYQRAIAGFSTAISLDPGYAAAYAGRALARFWIADASDDAAGYDSALADAAKAIALAPGLAAGYAARGFVRAIHVYDSTGAQADMDKAVALNPGAADVLHRSAVVLGIVGDLPGAIAREQKALELDPLSAEICMRLAFFLAANQQLAQARHLYEKALAIAPNSIRARYNLGELELLENRPADALVDFRNTALADFRLIGEAKAEFSLGHHDESQRILEQLITNSPRHNSGGIASIYAWRGEKEKAFEWAERAVVQRDSAMTWIKIDPNFRSLRGDPRYTELLRKMNLPQ
jgi:TolB-like protein